MIATAQGKENAAAGYTGPATHASLHTADPGSSGANELTGGSPAYARKPITWNAGPVDGVYTSNPLSFDVPPSSLTFAGLWTAATGGTYLDKAPISVTFGAQGVYQLTLTATAG